jgi:hypothetical protein
LLTSFRQYNSLIEAKPQNGSQYRNQTAAA